MASDSMQLHPFNSNQPSTPVAKRSYFLINQRTSGLKFSIHSYLFFYSTSVRLTFIHHDTLQPLQIWWLHWFIYDFSGSYRMEFSKPGSPYFRNTSCFFVGSTRTRICWRSCRYRLAGARIHKNWFIRKPWRYSVSYTLYLKKLWLIFHDVVSNQSYSARIRAPSGIWCPPPSSLTDTITWPASKRLFEELRQSAL
jgi:hypothetical protein